MAEREKSARKLALAGSKLGNIMGVKSAAQKEDDERAQKEVSSASTTGPATELKPAVEEGKAAESGPARPPPTVEQAPVSKESAEREAVSDGVQFSSHVEAKNEAVSIFAKTRSIKQQREYLPVFAIREEMMQVIRDNQTIVIVGETGSGKVCTVSFNLA